VIIPIIITFAYLGPPRYLRVDSFSDSNLSPLALWVASIAGNVLIAGEIEPTVWGANVTITSLVMSMTVNALVTGLIVFRIFKVFREVKGTMALDEKCSSLGGAGGRKLRYIMFVLIESGIALFSIQLARVVPTAFSTDGDSIEQDVFSLVVSCHEILNVTKTTSCSLLTFFY
jgi:hypothetical protein